MTRSGARRAIGYRRCSTPARSGGAVARERAEQLVGEVTDLYGAGLERMLRIAVAADPALVDAFVADDLVASLLLVHGLHPHDVERRIEDALDSVRPYLGSHGGDVKLLGVVDDVVRLQFAGSCKSCPSSAVTLELTVEDAVRAAAPEIAIDRGGRRRSSTECQGDSGGVAAAPRPPERSRPRSAGMPFPTSPTSRREKSAGSGWRAPRCWPAGSATSCSPTRTVAATAAARWPAPRCIAGWGAAVGEAVLRCPQCRAHFDVVHAGAGVDENADTSAHLDPIPLLSVTVCSRSRSRRSRAGAGMA